MSELPGQHLTSSDRRTARAFDGWLTTRIRAAAARRRRASGTGGASGTDRARGTDGAGTDGAGRTDDGGWPGGPQGS